MDVFYAFQVLIGVFITDDLNRPDNDIIFKQKLRSYKIERIPYSFAFKLRS